MFNFFLKNLWLWKCNIPEENWNIITESIEISEWSETFEKLMRNRLIMGALRYGRIHQEGKPRYDRMESILKRGKQYQITGNTELLIDIANLCLLEFEEGNHKNKHFNATDDKEHVKIL